MNNILHQGSLALALELKELAQARGLNARVPAVDGELQRPVVDNTVYQPREHRGRTIRNQHALRILQQRLAGTLSERQREELIETAQRGLLHARSAPIWDPMAHDGMRPLSAMEEHERDAAIARYEDLLAVCLGEINRTLPKVGDEC